MCSLSGVGGFAAEQAQDNCTSVQQVAEMRERARWCGVGAQPTTLTFIDSLYHPDMVGTPHQPPNERSK